MNSGEITSRLVRCANSLLGHMRGGLAHVNILSSILFAGLSGSAVADTSALGSVFAPAMKKAGYTSAFTAAVTAASSIIGPIIPPSIIMVIYAYVMKLSVPALFAAGCIPGLLMGGGLMAATWFLAKKRNFPRRPRADIKEVSNSFVSAFLPLLTPLIILGGILSGIFTLTEAAGAAVIYALILCLFVLKSLKLKDLPEIFFKSVLTSSNVLLIIGAAVAFAWITSLSQIPVHLGSWVAALDAPSWILFLVANILLLIVGMFLDATPAILILGPILQPTMVNLGMHEVHFAILMCVNVTVGLCTPPMGMVLFVSSSVTGSKIGPILKELAPFWLVHLAVILLLTYVPSISLFLPRLLGYIR